MSRIRILWPIMTMLAGVHVIYTCLSFGGLVVVYQLLFCGWFLGMLFLFYLNASYQASVNPGLEKLDDPSYWSSAVGNAYLYVTDTNRWILYSSFLVFFFGVILVTPLGLIVVVPALNLDLISPLETYVSWFEGALLSFLMMMTVLTFARKETTQVTIKKPPARKKVCPKCGRETWIDFRICPSCGELLPD